MVNAGPTRFLAILVTVALGLAVAGCATTSQLPGFGHSHRAAPRRATVRQVGQDGPPAAAPLVAVVRGWAAALHSGRLQAAAGYFHVPSLFDDGAGPIEIKSLSEAESVNASLSCGSQVISAFRQGRSINVLFRLTARVGEGAACGAGVGETARVIFLIRGGQIVVWQRAPSLPGDPGTLSAPGTTGTQSTPSTPTTSTGTGTGSVI